LKFRVCYLTSFPVDFPSVGVKLRIDQLISALNGIDFVDLHVWRPESFHELTSLAKRNAVLDTVVNLIVAGLATFTSFLPRPFPVSIRHQIFRWLYEIQPDLVLVTHPMFTILVPDLIQEGFNTLVDTCNVEQMAAQLLIRQAKNPREQAQALCQYVLMRKMERSLLPQAIEVWAASERDVEQLSQILRHHVPVFLVPNVVNTGTDPFAGVDDLEPLAVGFVANFAYSPYALAAEQLLLRTLPRLRESVPGVRLYLIGHAPSRRLCELAAEIPNVVVTGTVDDTHPWIARCAVLVAPIENDFGTHLKILEGLAMSKPMVSTPKGCAGLDLLDGVHLMIRDLQSFPEAIATLLLNPNEAQAMGQRGRILVDDKYSTTGLRVTIRERLEALLHTNGHQQGDASPDLKQT
jgi:glycosyltransferase involved in cell wall biosynthesis